MVKLVDGIESNSGYTIFAINGKVVDAYGNNIEESKERVLLKKVTVDEEKLLKEVKNQISENYKVIDQKGKIIYNVKSKKYEFIVITDYVTNEDGSLGRSEKYFEIK